MNKIKNINIVLIAIIVLLLISIFSFNYGYQLGERKGYVRGMQKCLEGVENKGQQTEYNF